jgi:hypothetical protein
MDESTIPYLTTPAGRSVLERIPDMEVQPARVNLGYKPRKASLAENDHAEYRQRDHVDEYLYVLGGLQ